MKNKALKIGFIASLLPHIFCCGLPIILSVIGLIVPVEAHWHIIPHYMEPWLFVFSGLMLIISWYLVLRDCTCDCHCCEKPKGHKVQKIILSAITLVFIISLILHFVVHQH